MLSLVSILADQDPTGYVVGGLVTPVGVVLAIRAGWLRLPQELSAWQQRAENAETRAATADDKLEQLNTAVREQVVPAIVAMTAATTEATKEVRRARQTGNIANPTTRTRGRG